MKKTTALMAALMLTGCAADMTYADFERPAQPASTLSSTGDVYVEKQAVYDDAGTPDKCLETVSSDDGICTISRMEHTTMCTSTMSTQTPHRQAEPMHRL